MAKPAKKSEVAAKGGKEETALEVKAPSKAALTAYSGLVDKPETVDARDLVLPKLLLMQGLSRFVAEAKAVMGEIRDSLEGKRLGDRETPVEIIPFASFKTWIIFKKSKGKDTLDYAGTFPVNAENATWEREATEKNGDLLKRFMVINYYVLLPDEIAKGEAFPYVVSFRSTSYIAGRKLETHKVKYAAIKRPICWKTFQLSSVYTENVKGKFFVYDVTPERVTTEEELAECVKWKTIIGASNVRVDDSDMVEAAAEASGGPGVDTMAADATY